MPKGNVPLLAFNRGLVSASALARVDVDRIRLSAEEMTNWLPKTQGSMILRPGFGYTGQNRNDAFGIDIDFVAATDDTALIELCDGKLRVRVNDVLVSRASVTTAVTTSNFASATGWTESNTGGGDCTFGGSGLTMNANSIGGLALCKQQVTCSGGNVGVRHALNITVTRGPVTFRCGSTEGGDEYVAETVLRTGMHSLAFTPSGNFWVQFQSDVNVDRIVASCAVASAGTMEMDIPWASADLPYVRWSQSADVVFISCDGYQQRRIERRATDSWSLVLYQSDTGPFFGARTSKVKLKVAATVGNTTLTSDLPFFKATHVGALFRLFLGGRTQTFNLGAEGAFTPAWRVNGLGSDNDFNITLSGTWSGTLRRQRSYDDAESGFIDVESYTTNGSNTETPGSSYDNIIHWYRIGFKPGEYTSGVATAVITYKGDGGYGIVRVTGYNSPTSVNVEVLTPIFGTEYTDDWQESIWSEKQGWPSAVSLHKGRLWWFGKSRFIGSVSDDYENFNPETEGDSGPINRTLGAGPVDTINFALSLGRLVIGTSGSEYSIKSTSFDEPLTPQNTQAGDPSTQGSMSGVRGAKIDGRGVFAQRSGRRLFELILDPDSFEYAPRDLTLLCPDLTGTAKVSGIAVQRQPDTRIHCWLDDGSVVVLTYEPVEEVVCWSRISMGGDGMVESIAVLPGEDEDQVYYRVKRTINSNTRRYLEKMAMEAECIGSATNKQADSFVVVSAVTGTSVTGLSHLEGKQVVAWGGGAYLGTYTVSGGNITLSATVTATDVMVGLSYRARYKSTKLAYAAAAGTALGQRKKLNYLGVIMRNTHNDGLYFGKAFDHLDPLPRVRKGVTIGTNDIFSEWDEPAFPFGGQWDTDSRLHLEANAPKPCELLACVLSVETNDKL